MQKSRISVLFSWLLKPWRWRATADTYMSPSTPTPLNPSTDEIQNETYLAEQVYRSGQISYYS